MAKKIINSKYATKEDFIAFKNEIITACKSEKRILREEFSTWKKGFLAWKNRMPSGHDLAVWKDDVVTAMKEERLENSAILGSHQEYEEKLENHEKRILAIEGGINFLEPR